ncbi:hypothetical protein LOTGIDRAFT_170539 [Lottia gigantea]|uniref:Uncharacterized protein n=1 Tax=Lottia gigantea TaxID=225164 RepID=V4B351_LOTGI|nr:hypothetical protein LOTGIDRAFT_170539 [Lottia gigantea]ESP04703.1 hypothetical protein LOTGIDRAFT_170539 [Lottia gigantea]
MNIFLDKYGTDTTTNLQLMKWANELNISPFYHCMRDEINNLKYKKGISEDELAALETKLNDNSEKVAIQQQLDNLVDKTQLESFSSLLSNLDDKITKQKIDLKQMIANINPGISEEKLTELETKLNDNSEIVAIQQQLVNVVDKTQFQNLRSLISNLDDKVTKQKIDLKQLIDNIKPGISEEKLTELETKLNDNSEIVAIQQQLVNVVDKTQFQNLRSLISNLDDKVTKQKIDLKQLIDNIKPGISEENLTELETKLNDNSEIDAIQKQLLNLVDKTQLENLKSLISKLDYKIGKQKIDLKQLINNIKPGISEDTWQKESTALETKFKTELKKELTNINQLIQNIYDSEIQQQITTINNEVLKQEKNIATLEKHLKENKKLYYFNLPVFSVRNTERIPTSETTFQLEGYGFILKIKVFSYISGNVKNIFDDSGNFNFRCKSLIEILFPVKVKIDSIFFSHPSNYFNASKIFEFIKDGEYVENKDLEVNDENNKPNHMYEIKTNGKYIDTFRMSIIPDNDSDILSIGNFDMILKTESSPSINIIRNPTPQKPHTIKSYTFLRTLDFEYVKLYFVNTSFSLNVRKYYPDLPQLIFTKVNKIKNL